MPRFRAVIALGLSLASGGCLQTTEPMPGEQVRQSARTASSTQAKAAHLVPHLSTSVEAEPRRIVTGTLATITLSITNHEREPVTLHFGSGCQLLFNVYDLHGNQVSETWVCGYFPTTLTLEGGETLRRRTSGWLAARFDWSRLAYVPLPAGPYRVHAFVSGHGYLSPPFVVQLLEQEPVARS